MLAIFFGFYFSLEQFRFPAAVDALALRSISFRLFALILVIFLLCNYSWWDFGFWNPNISECHLLRIFCFLRRVQDSPLKQRNILLKPMANSHNRLFANDKNFRNYIWLCFCLFFYTKIPFLRPPLPRMSSVPVQWRCWWPPASRPAGLEGPLFRSLTFDPVSPLRAHFFRQLHWNHKKKGSFPPVQFGYWGCPKKKHRHHRRKMGVDIFDSLIVFPSPLQSPGWLDGCWHRFF